MKTLANLIDEYLTHLRSLNYSRGTVYTLSRLLIRFNRYLADTWQVAFIDRLGANILKDWHEHLLSMRTKDGYPIKATGINRHIVAVRGWITYLADSGYVQKRLMDALPYLKEPKTLPQSVLTHVQMRRLLGKIATDTPENFRNRTMLELLYSTGMRAHELLQMDLKDVDISHHTALVLGKGNKERVVPIGKTALQYLESYIVAVRPYLLKNRNEQALFLSRGGKRMTYQPFRRMVAAAAHRSGLDVPVSPHTFRRTCATEMIRNGANMYHVKELLGHESLETLEHYVKLTIIDLKKTHAKCHPREREGD